LYFRYKVWLDLLLVVFTTIPFSKVLVAILQPDECSTLEEHTEYLQLKEYLYNKHMMHKDILNINWATIRLKHDIPYSVEQHVPLPVMCVNLLHLKYLKLLLIP